MTKRFIISVARKRDAKTTHGVKYRGKRRWCVYFIEFDDEGNKKFGNFRVSYLMALWYKLHVAKRISKAKD